MVEWIIGWWLMCYGTRNRKKSWDRKSSSIWKKMIVNQSPFGITTLLIRSWCITCICKNLSTRVSTYFWAKHRIFLVVVNIYFPSSNLQVLSTPVKWRDLANQSRTSFSFLIITICVMKLFNCVVIFWQYPHS